MQARAPREIVFFGSRVRVGKFRARPTDGDFANTGPTRACLVVFPRTAVRIRHAGHAPIVADPTSVVFYNDGQEYERALVSPEGDACEWIAFQEDDVVAAHARFDPRAVDRPERPFALTHAPADARVLALGRVIHREARALSGALANDARGREVTSVVRADGVVVEEAAMHVLSRVVAAAYEARGVHARATPATRARHVELADAARAEIARRFTDRVALGDVARALGVSAFHLCRVFRRETGHTVHGYLDALRVRHGLTRLLDETTDVTSLALDLGYASHSHFTLAFRRAFGVPPSEARRIARRRGASKILTARL